MKSLALYRKRAAGAKALTDPTGERTGCEPPAKDAMFLPDEPLSKEDSEAVLKELNLR